MSKRKVDPENVTGALAERATEKGRRIKLTRAERDAFIRQQRAEQAAAYFLDLSEGHTWKEIADAMELSPHQLRDLTKTEEFDEAYNKLFVELGHDPRYKAAKGALADMLPLAVGKLKDLISSDRTAAGTKLRAIEKVIALNGLENVQPVQSDRQELVEFLVENKIDLTAVQIVLPTEYREADLEIIEGSYTDTIQEEDDTQDTPLLRAQSEIQEALDDEALYQSPSEPSSSTPESLHESDEDLSQTLFHHRGKEEQTVDVSPHASSSSE